MKICKKCVIPANFPHITFNEDGVCNLCRSYIGRSQTARLRRKYRNRFEALLKEYAHKGGYDILMCYSGGKDSTYTLNMLKNIYGLNVLAVTIDNGFVPPRTYVNIRNIVEKLKVDHIFFKPRFDILRKIFKASMKRCLYPQKTLERASTICTSCIGLVKYISIKFAVEEKIPFVGFGWSPGQAPVTSSILKIEPIMLKSMERVLKGPMSRIAGQDIAAYFLSERHYSRPQDFPFLVHPLGFLEYNEKNILRTIKKLGWRMPYGVDLNATNCLLNSFADKVHIAKYRFHPYVLEISNFVREGCMSRQEALKHLPVKKNQKIIRFARKRLGIL